jgi:hypothetical protein
MPSPSVWHPKYVKLPTLFLIAGAVCDGVAEEDVLVTIFEELVSDDEVLVLRVDDFEDDVELTVLDFVALVDEEEMGIELLELELALLEDG